MEITQNSGNKGINTDLDEYLLPNDTLRYAQNLRLISSTANSYVMQNVEGNEVSFKLTQGFIPIGVTTDNVISYIFSYNPYTAEGEIGTFPSPDYSLLGTKTYIQNPSVEAIYPFSVDSNKDNHTYYYNSFTTNSKPVLPLIQEYHPLMNLNLDSNGGLNFRKQMRSTLFKFDLSHPIVSECFTVLSYDYSYNIEWTDNKNPVRIVNGSICYINNQYSINDRVYTEGDFETEINLILNTQKYTKVDLIDIPTGGQLKFGNYFYFIKYKTQDQNTTNIIAQSSIVSVFKTIDAGVNSVVVYGGSSQIGENTSLGQNFTDVFTDRKVVLNLSDLDTTYSSFRVIVQYSTGDDISASEFYELDKDFTFNSSTLQIEHTGFESILTVADTTINQSFYTSFTAKSITQVDGRLFATNIKLVNQNFEALDAFAKCFYLDYATFDVGNINTIDQSTDISTFFTNGYRNPLFIYNNLGYWGGETYAFGLVFKLKDGAETQVYLPVGYDYTKTGVDLTSSRNEKGIVRLPNTESPLEGQTMKGKHIILKFDFTTWNNLLPQQKEYIEKSILGYKVTRVDRNKDCVTQGVVCTTYSIPTFNYEPSSSAGSWLFGGSQIVSWNNAIFRKTESDQWNLYQVANDKRVIPAPNGVSETEWVSDSPSGDFKRSCARKFIKEMVDEKRYALYSPDLDLDRTTRGRFEDVTYGVKPICKNTYTQYRKSGAGATESVFLLYSPTISTIPQTFELCKSFIVDVNRDLTSGRFASKILNLQNDDFTADESWFREHIFESYIGLVRVNPNYSPISFSLSESQQGGALNNGGITAISQSNTIIEYTLCNIYNDSQRSNYLTLYPQTDILQYKPVTQGTLLNFQELNNGIFTNENMFRGDCYVGEYYKRLWYCASGIGYTGTILQIVTENNSNPYLRHNELVDINEGQRIWYPFGNIGDNTQVSSSYNNANTDWGLQGNVNLQLLLLTRYNKIPYSKAYNKGYSNVLGEQRYVSFDTDLPSQALHYPVRVLYSEQQVGLSFTNYHRQIPLTNTQDYGLEYGEAVDIDKIGYSLYLTQERAISKINYKERLQVTNEGQVFIGGTGVLPAYSQLLVNIGSQHTFSVKVTDNTIYGIDVNRRKLWAIYGDDVKPISDDVVSFYLRERLGDFNMSDIEGALQVRTFWDKTRSEVLFNFYISSDRLVDSENGGSTFNLSWSEKLQVFHTFFSYSSNQLWTVNNKTYSFPSNLEGTVYGQNNTISGYIHNSNDDSLLNTFYGNNQPTIIDFVVNDKTAFSKVFDNHSIISNNIYPDEIQWNTENQRATRTREWLLKYKRLRQEENRVQVVIGSSDTDKNEQYNHNRVNSRIRDKYVRARFTYNPKKKLRIQTILTKYRISNV